MSSHPSVMACSVPARTRRCRGARFFCILPLLLTAGCGRSDQDQFNSVAQAVTAIAFVQTNYATPQNPVSTVGVPFTLAQSAGDLNVVVVGWNDTTAQVVSVTDTKGNAYQLAVGPTLLSGALSQSIYYARNIAAAGAGANTVTVSFTVAAVWADVRILEYSGLDPANPVDVTAAATGSTATSSTPAAVTTNASDLLFAANTVATSTIGAGTGWTSRVITVPDGDIAEDRVVSAAGSYGSTTPSSLGLRVLDALFGAGLLGLRSLATGIPLAVLANPRKALAAGCAPSPAAQYILLSSSVSR